MRGKMGLVIGLAAGYVLGTRAGRERYEQIKAQAAKVWELPPVQQQVTALTDIAKSSVMALPGALWDGAIKAAKAASTAKSPGQKLDAVIKTGKAQVDTVAAAAETSAAAAEQSARAAKKAAKKAVADVIEDISKADNGANGA